MKKLYVKNEFNLGHSILRLATYDVAHSLTQQELSKQIMALAGKEVLKYVGSKQHHSIGQRDEICQQMIEIIDTTYRELIKLCTEEGIIVNFVHMPAALQLTKYANSNPFVVATRLISDMKSMVKQFTDDEVKQVFVMSCPTMRSMTQDGVQDEDSPFRPFIRYYASTTECPFTLQEPEDIIVRDMQYRLQANWKKRIEDYQTDPIFQQIYNEVMSYSTQK